MIGLLEHPEAQAALRRDPARIGAAVDELLRWWTPVMTVLAAPRRPTEVGGVPVAAGDKVVVSFASANRDEQVFRDPTTDSDATRGPTWPSGTGHTSASEPISPASRCARCSPRC